MLEVQKQNIRQIGIVGGVLGIRLRNRKIPDTKEIDISLETTNIQTPLNTKCVEQFSLTGGKKNHNEFSFSIFRNIDITDYHE